VKKILIFRAVKVVIEKAKELGYITVVIDKDNELGGKELADYYKCISFEDLDGCLAYAKEMQIDGVVSASEFSVITAGYIATNMNLPGISYETAMLCKNKYEMCKVLEEKNVNAIPQFFKVMNVDELESIKEKLKFPVIVKPNEGIGSEGVTKAENVEELRDKTIFAQENAPTQNNTTLIQTFISGQEYGVESFVYDGTVYVLGIMKKLMTPPPYYSELGHCSPSGLDEQLENRVKELVTNTIKALGINIGPVNIDLIITKNNELYIIDIGARIGGNSIASHIIPATSGIDHIANTIKVAMDEPVVIGSIKNTAVASIILTLTPGRVKSLPDFTKYYDESTVSIACKLKEDDEILEYKTCANVYGNIILRGSNLDNLIEKALYLKERIDSEIIRY